MIALELKKLKFNLDGEFNISNENNDLFKIYPYLVDTNTVRKLSNFRSSFKNKKI